MNVLISLCSVINLPISWLALSGLTQVSRRSSLCSMVWRHGESQTACYSQAFSAASHCYVEITRAIPGLVEAMNPRALVWLRTISNGSSEPVSSAAYLQVLCIVLALVVRFGRLCAR